MEPHPDSDGVIGTEGCVSAYLEAQGALPFLDAADRYMTVFQNYYRELSSIQKDAQFGRRASDKVDIFTAPKLELLNTDKVVARLRAVSGARNINPEIVMELHIEELEDWLSQFQAMENRDER
jgi:hypothetical protein